jgi:hypothetical protein
MGMADRATACGGTATGSSAGGSGAAVDAQDSGEGPCDGARAEVHRGEQWRYDSMLTAAYLDRRWWRLTRRAHPLRGVPDGHAECRIDRVRS